MEKKIFLLLGGNKLNYGILKKFKNKGYLVYVIDWNEHPQIVGDKHYKIDVKDSKAIIEALKKDGVWSNVKFAYSSIDLAVRAVADLNKEIGLNTISDIGVGYASSKSMMTERWDEVGILNRLSKSYKQYSSEIVDLNKIMKIIIKPDNSASSRGITIVPQNSDEKVIMEAFEKAYKEASDNMVVVEECIEGVEFTVDMIGDCYGNVSVYGISRKTHTRNTVNNKIAVKLHYNSVSDELQKRIAEVGIACYRALDFSSSLGHLELLLKDDGTISPVEIGARSSGYIASDLVDIVSGSDYLWDLMKVQNGECVKNGLHSQTDKSSMYFFYDFPEDSYVINECSLLDFCDNSIVSRYYDRSNLKVGNHFKNIDNDNSRYGFEILEGPKKLMTREYISNAEAKMLAHMLNINDSKGEIKK